MSLYAQPCCAVPGSGQTRGKGKEKKEGARQTTLFGLPATAAADKKSAGRKKKAGTPAEESQESVSQTQATDETQTISMDESQEEPTLEGDTQVNEEPTQTEETQVDDHTEADEDMIEWPASPEPRTREIEASAD